VLAWAAVALSACGGGSDNEGVTFKRGGPPPPAPCIERWNRDQEAIKDGLHAYNPPHDSRAARVFDLGDEYPELNGRCAVVFAVAESDREYGAVGWFDSTGTWDVMVFIPSATPEERAEIQRRAREGANARLLESGRLAGFH
jgi:hypothetical protein